MERKIVAVLFVLFLFVNLVPFLYGAINTPSDMVFLGTVHYPIDYLYYLSFITQGEDHVIRSTYISTTEPMPKLFLGSVYVLLGRLGSIFAISPVVMYQIGLTIFGFLFLLGAYLLIQEMFPKSPEQRIITFLCFMFSNTLPRIVEEGGKTILAPYFSWYNFGEPFLRLNSVPHHLLIQTLIFFIILSFLKRWYIPLALCSITLANIQPVQWMLLIITATIFLCMLIITKKISLRYSLLLLGIFFFSGLPVMLYMKTMFAKEPFASLSQWEAAQSPTLLQWQFIQYHGIIFLAGILGVPIFLMKKNLCRYFVAIITGISVGMFLLPQAKHLPILTFRYLSSLPILFYAASATALLYVIAHKTGKLGLIIKGMWITLCFFLLVPLFFIQLSNKLPRVSTASFPDPNVYVHKDVYMLFRHARAISKPDDTFLVYPPYLSVFQAVAARKQYVVTQFSTIDFDRKMNDIYLFLDKQQSINEHRNFLQKHNIRYVITNVVDDVSAYPFLKKLHQNSHLALYEVSI